MPTQRKILTVVLLSASAGCGATAARTKPVAATPPPAPMPVPKVAASASVIEPVLVASAIPSRPALPPVPSVIKDDSEQPEALMRLRSELYGSDEMTINVSHAKFRALCDENGYPVVGNVASKSMRHDVSSFCEDVRTQLVMR
jgi:hypothetical protein